MTLLKDIAEIKMGLSPPGISYNNNRDGIPLLNGAADYKGNIFNPKQYTNKPTVVCKKGDILMCIRATIGNIVVSDDAYCLGRGLSYIRITKGNINQSFVIHQLNLAVQRLTFNSNGSTIKGIKKEDLENIEILLHDIKTQNEIAEAIDDSDKIRQKRKQQIELLDEYLKSVFYEMFGDPMMNEKGWEIISLNNCIDYIGDIGSNGSNAIVAKNLEMSDIEDYAIMVRTTNLSANDFKKNLKYVSKKTYDFFSKSQIFGGEIIMNKIGSAGNNWIMPFLNRPVSLGLNQLVIRLKNLNSIYLYHYLSTNYGKSVINASINGAVTKSITKAAVKQLPLLYPSLSFQNQFAEVVKHVEKTKAKMLESLKEMDNLFNSLMQRAFKA